MLPVQILINNLLYDASQLTIPANNVDENYTQKPRHWDLKMIRNYMIMFGVTSSVFDMLTFHLLYKFFAVQAICQLQSKPARALVISALTCVFIGWLLPRPPFSKFIAFQRWPWYINIFIIALVVIYLEPSL